MKHPLLPRRLLRGILLLSLFFTLSLSLAAGDSPTPPPPPTLAELEARAPVENGYPTATPEFHRDVLRLVESNTLATGDEFFRAAQMAAPPIADFRSARVRYELALAAVGRDSRDAESLLAFSWDILLGTLGRPYRLDTMGLVAGNPDNDAYTLDPAPPVIQNVLRNPGDARSAAATATDNPEIQSIVDADQAVRANWHKLTPADWPRVGAEDRQRSARIRELIANGDLHTAADFANAALVMQHSSSFAGFQLAHELAVCSLLLGDRGRGRWLVAASYDRMLRSIGHDQRFGTQGAPTVAPDAKPTLATTDETGICDQQRLALGCPTLAAKRADFFTPKPAGG